MSRRLSVRTSTIFYCPIWGLQDRFYAVKGVMPVDCPQILARRITRQTQKLNVESEEKPLKKYDVTLTAHYEKTISVCAESAEQAKAKTEIILFDTDLINFTDEDFICGEAKINESCEDGAEDTDEEEANEDECCSDCPYFCPVCGECMCEDECNE